MAKIMMYFSALGLLLLSAPAYADDGSSSTLYSIGGAIGTIMAAALASGGAVWGANRSVKPPTGLPDGMPELLARLDERTEHIQEEQGRQGKRAEITAKRIHKHGNALLILLAREGHSPKELQALKTLQDESEEDDVG